MGIEKKWEVRARGLGPGTADLEPEGVLTLILWLTLSQTPPPPPLRPPRPPPPRGPLPPAVPTRLPVSGCHVHELSGQPLHLPPPAPLLPSDEVLLQGCVSPCGALSCGPGPYLPDALPSFSPRHPFRCGNKKCLQSPSEVPWGTVSPGGEWQNWAPPPPCFCSDASPRVALPGPLPRTAPLPSRHPLPLNSYFPFLGAAPLASTAPGLFVLCLLRWSGAPCGGQRLRPAPVRPCVWAERRARRRRCCSGVGRVSKRHRAGPGLWRALHVNLFVASPSQLCEGGSIIVPSSRRGHCNQKGIVAGRGHTFLGAVSTRGRVRRERWPVLPSGR